MNTTPRLWRIRNHISDVELGVYPAPTGREALEVMARAMGYRDYSAALEAGPGLGDVQVKEFKE